MKKVSLLFAFVALFATASFASTGDVKKINSKAIITIKKVEPLKKTSCTVHVTTGGYNVTITNTCENCTPKQACDGAYAIATLLL